MTVMPSSSDVADKAVSTEDASSGVEVARLEAVLAALVETKVEAMKASASAATTARRAGSAPPSPRRSRLTSSSTVSSSQNHHHHHHHHHHHQHHQQHHQHQHQHYQHQQQPRYDKRRRHEHRHRRHGSAPCGDFVEDHQKQRHGRGKHTKGTLEASPRSRRKRRRECKSAEIPLGDASSPGFESRFELLGADPDVALIKFDRASRELVLSDGCEDSRLHQSACYISHSSGQSKSLYDEYPSFNFADDVDEEEEETFSRFSSRLSGPVADPLQEHQGYPRGYLHRHRPRRKRKRRKRGKRSRSRLVDVDVEGVQVELGVDPDDLPPRARWTIVATACLLLAMSLLLVGVTLRMAPIIDEMVRKENEELLNSLNRDSSTPENTTTSISP